MIHLKRLLTGLTFVLGFIALFIGLIQGISLITKWGFEKSFCIFILVVGFGGMLTFMSYNIGKDFLDNE